jgi:sugar phosphate isomerase/epimerase
MYQGIFEAMFPGNNLAEKLAQVRQRGFSAVQFNLESAGLELVPEEVPAAIARTIHQAMEHSGIRMASLAGTCNMIDPDRERRHLYLARLRNLAGIAPVLGAPLITLCTGTRDPDNMWRWHAGNDSSSAWVDLLTAMGLLLAHTADSPVLFGIEPEPANVVSNARKARQLIEELADDRVRIVLDPANIVAGDSSRSPEDQLNEAFDLLGDRIALAHAKDVDREGHFCAVGTGVIPWPLYADLLRQTGYGGAVIMHSLTVDQIEYASSVLSDAGIPLAAV